MKVRAMHWVDIGALDRHPAAGRALRQHTASAGSPCSAPLSDEVFALEDRCPHRGGPLSQGIVHGASVTCPLHNWVISLETGEALGRRRGMRRRPIPVQVSTGGC